MTDELKLVRQARPRIEPASEEARAEARRSLDQVIAGRGGPRGRRARWGSGMGLLVPALSALVVAAVVVVFLGLHTQRPSGAGGSGGLRLVFRAAAMRQTHAGYVVALQRTVLLVRRRLAVALPGARVGGSGDELTVTASRGSRATVGEVRALLDDSRLLFYDWEANALTLPGLPVARALLHGHHQAAMRISEGAPGAAPGQSGAGSLPLYGAVRLAARQSRWASPSNSRGGPEYFMFGKRGSAACAAAARYYHTSSQASHCYLAGPKPSQTVLARALPPGISPSARGAQTLAVPQGWVVLQAIPPSFGEQRPWSDPAGAYYVLRDNVALSSSGLTDPHASRDGAGAPDVTFGFTHLGARQFQNLTARIARRGQLVSGRGQPLYQHFAVALATQLITVPYIDYQVNPNGIPGKEGADIRGGFTAQTARQLAAQITPLPLSLKLVSVNGRATGSADTATACKGLPTAKYTRPPMVLFGAIRKLDKRFLCAQFGRPNRVTQLSEGRQLWRYDGDTFTLRHGHVIAYHQPLASR